MQITRAKASGLLNKGEMALYDDSRANALRQLDERGLAARVTRARAARDRARDLVQRQKLASRERTGSKRGTSGAANQRSKDKADLLADILSRFETQARGLGKSAKAGKTAKPATSAKSVAKSARPAKSAAPAARKSGARKTATTAKRGAADSGAGAATSSKKAVGKSDSKANRRDAKAATKKAIPRSSTTLARKAADDAGKTAQAKPARQSKASKPASVATAKAASKTAGAKTASATRGERAPASKKAAGRKKPLTPAQALARTKALLEAKQAEASAPKPWQAIGGTPVGDGSPGFQSSGAATRAEQLHAAETRMPAIQGSISTRDRINQGKRDRRRQVED